MGRGRKDPTAVGQTPNISYPHLSLYDQTRRVAAHSAFARQNPKHQCAFIFNVAGQRDMKITIMKGKSLD